MDNKPAPICRLCSKPIRAGTGTARVAHIVVHVRCIARQEGQLKAWAAEAVRRAERLVAQSKARRAKAWS